MSYTLTRVGADITSSLGMKTTIELCHQKCRLIQACSHNRVGIYIMVVGGGVDFKGWFSVQCQCGQSRSNNRHKEKKPDNIYSLSVIYLYSIAIMH